MVLKKLSILGLIIGMFLTIACGPGMDNRQDNERDTTNFNERTMPRDSVYPLDTQEMRSDTSLLP